MQRYVGGVTLRQMLVGHLAGGKGEVGQLHEQEAAEKIAGNAVVTDKSGAEHCDGRGDQCPGVEAAVERVIDQRHVQRREHGEEQHLGHRQHVEAQVQAQVGDAELQRTDQGHADDEAGGDTAPAGKWQEHQASEDYSGQHGEIAVYLAGQVNADQVEGKGPEQGDEDQIAHAASTTKAGDLSGCA